MSHELCTRAVLFKTYHYYFFLTSRKSLSFYSSLIAWFSFNCAAVVVVVVIYLSTRTQVIYLPACTLLTCRKGDKKAVSPRSDEVVPLPHFVPPTAFHSQRAGG